MVCTRRFRLGGVKERDDSWYAVVMPQTRVRLCGVFVKRLVFLGAHAYYSDPS